MLRWGVSIIKVDIKTSLVHEIGVSEMLCIGLWGATSYVFVGGNRKTVQTQEEEGGYQRSPYLHRKLRFKPLDIVYCKYLAVFQAIWLRKFQNLN